MTYIDKNCNEDEQQSYEMRSMNLLILNLSRRLESKNSALLQNMISRMWQTDIILISNQIK